MTSVVAPSLADLRAPEGHGSYPPGVAAALVVAQRAARNPPRDEANKHMGYRYPSAATVLEAGRAALNGAGLALQQGEILIAPTEIQGVTALAVIEYRLAHSSGESAHFSRAWPVIVGQGRPFDKALAATATSALKYALMDLLSVRGDDDDVDARDDRPRETSRPPQAPPPSAPAPSAPAPSAPPASAPPPSAPPPPVERGRDMLARKLGPAVATMILPELERLAAASQMDQSVSSEVAAQVAAFGLAAYRGHTVANAAWGAVGAQQGQMPTANQIVAFIRALPGGQP